MTKSQVYSWRVSRETLASLERVAREEGVSVAAHLDRVVREDLARREASDPSDEARRRAAAERWFGAVTSGPRLDAEHAKARVRARIRTRHGR